LITGLSTTLAKNPAAKCAEVRVSHEILDSLDRIDLLSTNVVMPGGFSGKKLATKARAKRSDCEGAVHLGPSRHGDRSVKKARRGGRAPEQTEAILTAQP